MSVLHYIFIEIKIVEKIFTKIVEKIVTFGKILSVFNYNFMLNVSQSVSNLKVYYGKRIITKMDAPGIFMNS